VSGLNTKMVFVSGLQQGRGAVWIGVAVESKVQRDCVAQAVGACLHAARLAKRAVLPAAALLC
jgi:hypothetical protein